MDPAPTIAFARRPIRLRESGWVIATARWLARTGVHPNAISAASVGASALAAAALFAAPGAGGVLAALLYVATASCLQLRLLCNLFDGMVAIEGGRRSSVGGLWNELPDRFSDGICLVAAGIVAGAGDLGWLAAFLAAVTAYVRTLGASLGLPHSFAGPMAKQHRMVALTAGILLSGGEAAAGTAARALRATLLLIVAGTALTVVRRTVEIARALR